MFISRISYQFFRWHFHMRTCNVTLSQKDINRNKLNNRTSKFNLPLCPVAISASVSVSVKCTFSLSLSSGRVQRSLCCHIYACLIVSVIQLQLWMSPTQETQWIRKTATMMSAHSPLFYYIFSFYWQTDRKNGLSL